MAYAGPAIPGMMSWSDILDRARNLCPAIPISVPAEKLEQAQKSVEASLNHTQVFTSRSWLEDVMERIARKVAPPRAK